MIRFPNAKINLGLSVVSKRPDGYHNLETVFYPVPLCDALEITPNDKADCHLSVSGIQIDGSWEDNLIIKAYRLLQKDFSLPGLDVRLYKNIPFGAGMGGGSSDASFMLMMLRDQFDLPVSKDQLLDYAARLGADCPFFCMNRPVFAEGTGNVFTPLDFSLKGYHIVIIKPAVSVPTKDAFSKIIPQYPQEPILEIIRKPIGEWKGRLQNDFEKSVFSLYPQIRDIRESLYAQGAVYASMSGSGSSVFGIF